MFLFFAQAEMHSPGLSPIRSQSPSILGLFPNIPFCSGGAFLTSFCRLVLERDVTQYSLWTFSGTCSKFKVELGYKALIFR